LLLEFHGGPGATEGAVLDPVAVEFADGHIEMEVVFVCVVGRVRVVVSVFEVDLVVAAGARDVCEGGHDFEFELDGGSGVDV
jgi:hypothetical protein